MTNIIDTLTAQDFKDYFDRAFEFAPATDPDNPDYVRDKDILNAYSQAKLAFNQGIWENDDETKLAFLFLSAHYLCMDWKMDKAGTTSGGTFSISQKQVGNVSASYSIPEVYKNDPYLNYFSQTQFGCKYLSLVIPRCVGKIAVIKGVTTYE